MDKLDDWIDKIRYSKPVKTAAQTAVAVIGTNAVGITDVDWVGVASASGLAALLSVLTNLANGTGLSDHSEDGAE